MKKKLNNYIKELEEKLKNNKIEKDISNDILTNISFFQHERLVHLIVTFMTGIISILFFLGFLIIENILLLILFIISMLLFIPYILHYYTLENGTQKLYDLYFKIKEKTED